MDDQWRSPEDGLNQLAVMRAIFATLLSDDPEVVAKLDEETKALIVESFHRHAEYVHQLIDEQISQPRLTQTVERQPEG